MTKSSQIVCHVTNKNKQWADCLETWYLASRTLVLQCAFLAHRDEVLKSYYDQSLPETFCLASFDRLLWNLVCIIWGFSSTKVILLMNMGWPWCFTTESLFWFLRLLNGKNLKSAFICCREIWKCGQLNQQWTLEDKLGQRSQVKIVLSPFI